MVEVIEKPTDLELKNAVKVGDLLAQIEGISFQQQTKQDIFVVDEEDTELQAVVDVEEDIVAVMINVSDTSNINATELLELNATALYGAFAIEGSKLLFKNNLDIENLDLNELQSTLTSVFYNVNKYLESLSN